MSATTDNVTRLIEAQVPGAAAKFRSAVLFQVVADFCRNVLQTPAPTDYTTDPTGWMPDAQWQDNQLLIISGVLARLLLMPNKPWANPTAAQAHAALYIAELDRARERYATLQSANDGYSRIMQNIRALVPGMRDASINQELFNTVDELRRNILQVQPAAHTAVPQSWMTSDEYSTYFRLIMAGTLFRIYAQSSKPWSDPKAAALQQSMWNEEVSVARGDAGDNALADPSDRVMSNIRQQLPGVKDAAIYVELFNVIDEACRQWYVWVEVAQYILTAGRQTITITPEGTDIVRIASIRHPKLGEGAQFDADLGAINIPQPVTADVAQYRMTITMALAPKITLATDDPKQWIPADLWGKLHQLLLEGTLSRLMLQPAKAWSNPALAVMHGQRHRRLLIEARQNVMAEGVIPATQNWTFPRFA